MFRSTSWTVGGVGLQDYIHKLIEGAKPVWAAFVAALCYVLFPDVAFQAALGAVGFAMLLDIFTRLWAISKCNGGYRAATRLRKIWSRSLWSGTLIKLYAYLIVFILAGLSYRVAPVAQAAVFLATVVYSVIFLREAQSIVENLCDAGADLGWLLIVVKKRQDDILKQQDPERK